MGANDRNQLVLGEIKRRPQRAEKGLTAFASKVVSKMLVAHQMSFPSSSRTNTVPAINGSHSLICSNASWAQTSLP